MQGVFVVEGDRLNRRLDLSRGEIKETLSSSKSVSVGLLPRDSPFLHKRKLFRVFVAQIPPKITNKVR